MPETSHEPQGQEGSEMMRRVTYRRHRPIAAVTFVAALGLSACSPQISNHGYVPPAEDLDQIVVGKDTRATVSETVGTPSSAGVLNDSGFYFVRSRKRSIAFLAPREIERQVVAISFDGRGVVSNVERFGLEKGQVVALERRVTSSAVSNKTFLRQLLGAIGNFSPAAALGG